MVRYSNIHDIHPALAAAVQYVPPKVRTEDFRVTELTRPALMTYLEMIHDDKIVVDVGERGDLLDGVSVHEALARANISDALQEENITMEIAGVTVSGRPDWYKDGIISDFKSTKGGSMFWPSWTGVATLGLVVVGLFSHPYVGKTPRCNGYYTFAQRPLSITTFLVGFVILWVVLIIFGTFLRGPNWNFFGPYEYWDHHRPAALLNTEFHDLIWIGLLGRALPENFLVRELPGILLLGAYFVAGPLVLRALFFRKMYVQLGLIRFNVVAFLLLMMLLMPIKMVLRWTLNLHYIVGITEWFFNV